MPPATAVNLSPLSADALRDLLRRFLDEDIGQGDWTTEAIVRPDQRAAGEFLAKSPLVLAGIDFAMETFRLLDPKIEHEILSHDGDRVPAGQTIARIRGRAQALLSAERVALNLTQRLSGIATLTRAYVDAVAGTGAAILDTRKTTPGLRALEKYAVRAGGGTNHRVRLDDAILIKENHARLAGGVGPAVRAAQAARRGDARWLEVEVDSIAELDEALAECPDAILVDNFTPEIARAAIARARKADPEHRIAIEASGGITLVNVRQFAEAGVDRISVGALTHSAPAADISLEIEPEKS
ncbi:MAG: carboxylating nicotinate-nucleotide diphosphorylase [Candidatus Acidiferrales bacterium]